MAERRQAELAALRLRLASGVRLTQGDVAEAALRLSQAQERALAAEFSARSAHRDAAAAHQNAARVNERAGLFAKAQQHRQAAELDLAESAGPGQ